MFSLQIIPLVYVLLIGKSTDNYNDFFEQLLLQHDFQPESILVDFESATLKSIKTNFPNAHPIGNCSCDFLFTNIYLFFKTGCLFHMGQCLWRELRTLGFQNKYTDNDKFRMNVKKLMALAFMPVSDVIKGYVAIVDDFDEEEYPLLDYFERVWVGQKKGRGSCLFKCIYLLSSMIYNPHLGNQRAPPKFSLQLWNMYEDHPILVERSYCV